MATYNGCTPILKDVVAYVDVWSSNKTENYSKPFIEQLKEMGAEVSKTFTKHVTHVVFKNGHQATWNKAKKKGAKLVSVLWVARCGDDGEFVDEERYPALNDEGHLMLKKRAHRCMQPKDSVIRTPENDRRMKKKLDKIMKDRAPPAPLFTEESPYIIDEENGIVYSPSLKRSDSMAQRLKEMRKQSEDLSPTASQVEASSSSLPVSRPCLGFTPTILKLLDDRSDEESTVAFSESSPGRMRSHPSSCEEEEIKLHSDTDNRGNSDKPWLSPCSEVPKRKSVIRSNPISGARQEEVQHKMSRRSSVKKEPRKQLGSIATPEVPRHEDGIEEDSENGSRKLKQLNLTFDSCAVYKSRQSPNNLKMGKGKAEPKTPSTKKMTHPNSPSCPSPPPVIDNTQVNQELAKGGVSKFKRENLLQTKQRRASTSALTKRSTFSSGSLSVASSSPAEEAGGVVFEDYFSPVNKHCTQPRPSFPSQPIEGRIHFPFDLGSMSGKRKQSNGECAGPESASTKKRKGKETQRASSQCNDAHGEPVRLSHPHNQEALPPPLHSPNNNLAHLARTRSRRKTLSVTTIRDFETQTVKQRTLSNPIQPSKLGLISASASNDPQKKSDVGVHSHSMEWRGSQHTVAAGCAETSEDEQVSPNKKGNLSCKNMEKQSKMTRTLVMTSVPTEKQQTVTQIVKLLGGFSIVDRVCESTTHVVSGGDRRTVNVLLGIARGCWILSFEWILWSLEKRQWIPEEPYELSDYFPAAPICRLQQHLSAGEHQQDLFLGQPAMFVSHQSQPPTQSLVELIQLCGGTVCKTVRQAGICIGNYNGRRPEGSKILSEKWILDCITQLKQLDYDNYNLE